MGLEHYWGTSCILGTGAVFGVDVLLRTVYDTKRAYQYILPCLTLFCILVSPFNYYMPSDLQWVFLGHVCLYGYMVIRLGVRRTAVTQFHTLSLYVLIRFVQILPNFESLRNSYFMFLYLFDIGSLALQLICYVPGWRIQSLAMTVFLYEVLTSVIVFGYTFVWTNTMHDSFLFKVMFGVIWLQRITAVANIARLPLKNKQK